MIERLDGGSLDIEKVNLEKLQSVFPDCVSEGKLDLTKLLALLGQYDDNDFEKYKFEWKGKSESLRLAQQRSMGTLRPCPEDSVDWDTTQNLYIEGDNLEVLKLLQTAYYRKVKMIYIDPPYNTGNDFVYEDDFADPIRKYKEVTAQTTKSNPETMGRYHTNWLNMMYPRLWLASNLLTDDGVIFISIDDNEVHNLRKLCDEVFGEENFVAELIWKKKKGGGNDSIYIAVEHEYALMYAKNKVYLPSLFHLFSQEYIDRYKEEDEEGKYFWDTFKRKSGKQYYPIECPDSTILEYDDLGNKISWLRSEPRFRDDVKKGDIRIIKINDSWSVQFKQRMPEGKKPRSILAEYGTTSNGSAELLNIFEKNLFDNPKPIDLLKHFAEFGSKNSNIILDFFSGSGTTAHAVMQLNKEDGGNRKFIMVQLPEVTDEKSEAYKAGYKNICEIGKERIRRAGAKIKSEWEAEQAKSNAGLFSEQEEPQSPPDTGFKVFKLDTSNLKTWDATPVDSDDAQQMELLLDRMNDMVDTIKSDRTDSDMVYEIMLKMGVPLDYPVVPVEIGGKQAYSIGENSLLLVCLQNDLTADIIEQMAEVYLPSKMILSEKCFADDTAMANAHYILKEREIELKLV